MKDDGEEIDDDRSADGSGSSVAGSNGSSMRTHVACHLCDMDVRASPTEREEKLDLHMIGVHGQLPDRISMLKDGNPKLAEAEKLIARDFSAVQALDNRPFNRSLFVRPLVTHLGSDIITWAELKRYLRDDLRSKDSLLEQLNLLQAVQCGATLTDEEFAAYLTRLVKFLEETGVPGLETLFQVDGLFVTPATVLNALNNMGMLHVYDQDNFDLKDIGYALPHRAKLNDRNAMMIESVYKRYKTPFDQHAEEKPSTPGLLLRSAVKIVSVEYNIDIPWYGRITLLDKGWNYTSNDGRVFDLPYAKITCFQVRRTNCIVLKPTSVISTGENSSLISESGAIQFLFQDEDDFIAAYIHAAQGLQCELMHQLRPADALLLQQALIKQGAEDRARAVRNTNPITCSGEVVFTNGHDEQRRSIRASMFYDPSGITCLKADKGSLVEWVVLGKLIESVSAESTSRTVRIQVGNIEVFPNSSLSTEPPLVTGRGCIDVTSDTSDVAEIVELLETYIKWRARANSGYSALPNALSNVPDEYNQTDDTEDVVESQDNVVGPSHVLSGHGGRTDDESLDLAESQKELGAAKRCAPSPPDEDSQHLLSISASNKSELADGEHENQEPTSSDNGFRYQVRVIDHESSLAALSIEANVLTIETYDMPDNRKQWTTKFRDIQDCAFGEDDVITLFGLESTWKIRSENLRIVAADLTMTEKLKAYILHYMDSRQEQTAGDVDRDQVWTGKPVAVGLHEYLRSVEAQASVDTVADNDAQSSPHSTSQHENTDNARDASIEPQQLPDDPYPPIDEEVYHTERVWLIDSLTRHSATLSIYATHIAFIIEAPKATWYIYSKNITHLRVKGIALLHGVVGEVPELSGGLAASISHKQLVIRPWFGRIDNMKRGLEECMRRGVSTQAGEHSQQPLLSSMPNDEGDGSVFGGFQAASEQGASAVPGRILVALFDGDSKLIRDDWATVRIADDHLHLTFDGADVATPAMRIWRQNFQYVKRVKARIYMSGWLERANASPELFHFNLRFSDRQEATRMNEDLQTWLRGPGLTSLGIELGFGRSRSRSQMPPAFSQESARDTPDRPGSPDDDLGASIAAHQPVDLREDEFVFEIHSAQLPSSGSIVYVEVTHDALLFHEPKLGRKNQWQILVSALEGLRLASRIIHFTWRLMERDISLVAVDEQQAEFFMARLRAMIEGSRAQEGLQELLLAGRVDEVEGTVDQKLPTLPTATTPSPNDELASNSPLGTHFDDEPLAVVVEGLYGEALKHPTTIVFTAEGIQFHFWEQNVLPRWWVMKVKSIQSWTIVGRSSSIVLLVDRMDDSATQRVVLIPQSEADIHRLIQGFESLKAHGMPVATSESITQTKDPGSEPSEFHERPKVDSGGPLSPQDNMFSRNLHLTPALSATPSFQVVARHSEWFGVSSRDWAPISGRLALGHSNMVMVSSDPLLDIRYDEIQSIVLKSAKSLAVDQNLQITKLEAETPESAQAILHIVRTRIEELQRNAEATEDFLVTSNIDSGDDNTVSIHKPNEKTTVQYPLHQHRATNELEANSNVAAEAEVEDGGPELDIPWQLCTRKYYWKYIDSEVVDSNTDHPPSVAFSQRNGWTEIMASWVCKEAIREARYKVTQVQKEVRPKTGHESRRKKFETCLCIEQPLHFEQVKKLVERTVEIYRGKPLPSPPPGMNERRKRVAGFDYQGTPDVLHRPDIAAEIGQAATTAAEDVDAQSYERIRLTTLAIPMHSLSQLITLNLEAMGLTFAHGFLPVYQSTMDYSSITNVELRNSTIYVTGDILVSATGRQNLYKAEEVTFEASDIAKASEIAQIIDSRSRATKMKAMYGRPLEGSEPAVNKSTRVTTIVRGHEHDITNLGLDSDYIEALPEDLREEVIMQRIAEKQSELREQQDAEGANPIQDATISRPSVVVGKDYAASEIRDSDANTVHSHDDRPSAREADLRQARSEKKAEQPDPDIHANPSLDRWAQIRARAADHTARVSAKHAQGSRDGSQNPHQRPDDDDDDETSGEETVESRVVRIKKRVAELTSDVATEAGEFPDPTKKGQLRNTGRDGYNHPPHVKDSQQSMELKGKSLLHKVAQPSVQGPQDTVAEPSLHDDEESPKTSVPDEILQKGTGHPPFVILAHTNRAVDDLLHSAEVSSATK